jgi:aminopeptidase N
MVVDGQLVEAFKALLTDTSLDPAMVALMLQLPTEALLHEEAETIYVDAIHDARLFMRTALAGCLVNELQAVYQQNTSDQPYRPNVEQMGSRSLKNAALGYLMLVDTGVELAWAQFQNADNMTDQAAALSALVNCPEAAEYTALALASFEQQFADEALVMNLWLQIQATNSQANGLQRVVELMDHKVFTMTNPNKIRSLIGAFVNANHVNFHSQDGAGYSFLTEQILALNTVNPQVAARLVTPLTKWKKFPEPNRQLMQNALQTIAKEPNLVKDLHEIVSKSL